MSPVIPAIAAPNWEPSAEQSAPVGPVVNGPDAMSASGWNAERAADKPSDAEGSPPD